MKEGKRGFYFGEMFFQVHALRNYLFPGTFIDSRLSNVYLSLDERFGTNVDPCS